MLHQRITEKGVMHTVACLLADDLRQELDIYGSYTVSKEEGEDGARVHVYSDTFCNIITNSAVESVMDVLRFYCTQYFDVSYHFDTITLGSGEKKRVLPCIEVVIDMKLK